MKKNKRIKILLYSVCSLVVAGVIFLAISYFGKGDIPQKNDSPQNNTKKQEQVERSKNNEETSKTTQEQERKTSEQEEQKNEIKNAESQINKPIQKKQNENKAVIQYKGEEVTKTPNVSEYEGKKLSDSEGIGTTGKIFESQKEALDFGKKEVVRLANADKKPRQFAISKVVSEDGSLLGWTVDIFEDNNEEKIVSNSGVTIGDNKE